MNTFPNLNPKPYSIAPEIFRQRMLIEGFFSRPITTRAIEDFFDFITKGLQLKTYGPPIIHATSGQGKEANQGFDAFVPLIDSGIYLAVWSNQKFLSLVIYTCKAFDEQQASALTEEYFTLGKFETKTF
jgi:S-adenosylmethionine decarboxylase